MTQIQNNEQENLIKFMKNNRPLPPRNHYKLEEELMIIINNKSQKKSSKNLLFWLIPSLLTGVLFLTWGNLNNNQNSLKIANNNQEIESFMVNTWEEAIGENVHNQQLANSEDDWLLLAEH
jgi:hypothetical protein